MRKALTFLAPVQVLFRSRYRPRSELHTSRNSEAETESRKGNKCKQARSNVGVGPGVVPQPIDEDTAEVEEPGEVGSVSGRGASV